MTKVALEKTAPTTVAAPTCDVDGRLTTTLFGALQADIDWQRDDLICESMRRPDSSGVRLRFSGEVANEQLAIIIALPDLVAGQTASNLPSNLTLTVAGSGRFFSTPDLSACFTDVESQRPLEDGAQRFAIDGLVSCTAPLGELNGDGAVTLTELSFSGVADWDAS